MAFARRTTLRRLEEIVEQGAVLRSTTRCANGASTDPWLARWAKRVSPVFQRGVHGGVVTVRGRAPHALNFEIGVRPGLPPLARYRSGDLAA